jgi:hypothetical protein
VARLSHEELADLVPCPAEDVRRLDELGLLSPDADGGFCERRTPRSSA